MITKPRSVLAGATLCATLSLAATTHADTLFGVHTGAQYWANDISGHVNTSSGSRIDSDQTLDLDSDKSYSAAFTLTHDAPLIPNARVTFNQLSFDGETTLTDDIRFHGQNFVKGSKVTSEIDLTHNDVTLFYRWMDNLVTIDGGINLRLFDGSIALQSAAIGEETLGIDQAVPMLFASTRISLPLTGVYVGGDAYFLSIESNKMTDLTAKVGYEIAGGLAIEGGYRVLRLKLDDVNDIYSNIKVDGAYASVNFSF
ncbi:Hypothetical protein HDN1F_08980 [gamma proteobacterium HdN1]|nr:Hypothetical protein HDN1F_08980 [gamma proteobacterium HdN1]